MFNVCVPIWLIVLSVTPAHASSTPTPTPTDTVIPTASATPTETVVPTNSATSTATVSATATPTITPTITVIPTATPTPEPVIVVPRDITQTSTITPTPTGTQTGTSTATPTPTGTVTVSASPTPTTTGSPTPTGTPTPTTTPTPSKIDTVTSTATVTFTSIPTNTPTPTVKLTHTYTHLPTHTPTLTSTITPQLTPARSITSSPTPTPTPTPTRSTSPTITTTTIPSFTPTMSVTRDLAPPAVISVRTTAAVLPASRVNTFEAIISPKNLQIVPGSLLFSFRPSIPSNSAFVNSPIGQSVVIKENVFTLPEYAVTASVEIIQGVTTRRITSQPTTIQINPGPSTDTAVLTATNTAGPTEAFLESRSTVALQTTGWTTDFPPLQYSFAFYYAGMPADVVPLSTPSSLPTLNITVPALVPGIDSVVFTVYAIDSLGVRRRCCRETVPLGSLTEEAIGTRARELSAITLPTVNDQFTLAAFLARGTATEEQRTQAQGIVENCVSGAVPPNSQDLQVITETYNILIAAKLINSGVPLDTFIACTDKLLDSSTGIQFQPQVENLLPLADATSLLLANDNTEMTAVQQNSLLSILNRIMCQLARNLEFSETLDLFTSNDCVRITAKRNNRAGIVDTTGPSEITLSTTALDDYSDAGDDIRLVSSSFVETCNPLVTLNGGVQGGLRTISIYGEDCRPLTRVTPTRGTGSTTTPISPVLTPFMSFPVQGLGTTRVCNTADINTEDGTLIISRNDVITLPPTSTCQLTSINPLITNDGAVNTASLSPFTMFALTSTSGVGGVPTPIGTIGSPDRGFLPTPVSDPFTPTTPASTPSFAPALEVGTPSLDNDDDDNSNDSLWALLLFLLIPCVICLVFMWWLYKKRKRHKWQRDLYAQKNLENLSRQLEQPSPTGLILGNNAYPYSQNTPLIVQPDGQVIDPELYMHPSQYYYVDNVNSPVTDVGGFGPGGIPFTSFQDVGPPTAYVIPPGGGLHNADTPLTPSTQSPTLSSPEPLLPFGPRAHLSPMDLLDSPKRPVSPPVVENITGNGLESTGVPTEMPHSPVAPLRHTPMPSQPLWPEDPDPPLLDLVRTDPEKEVVLNFGPSGGAGLPQRIEHQGGTVPSYPPSPGPEILQV